MNKETITARQGILLITMFVIGSSVLYIMGLEAKRDIWLAMLIAIGAGLLITAMYTRLITILPGKDFYETIEFFFGKIGSKILLLLLTWFAFDLCLIVVTDFGHFIVTVGLPETPLMIIIFTMLFLCVFTVTKGVETLSRWSQLFIIFVASFIIIIMGLAIFSKIEFDHLKPVLYHGIKPVLKGSLGIITFPLAETVIFLLVLPAFKKGVNGYKVYMGGIVLGGIVILLTSVMNLLIMDLDYAQRAAFPLYEAVSSLEVGEALSRLEIIAASVFTVTIFLKIAILLMGASKGLSKLLSFNDYRFLVLPLALLVGAVALTSFKNVHGFIQWTFKVWPFYGGFFELVIPFLIWVFIEIKYRILKKQNKLPA